MPLLHAVTPWRCAHVRSPPPCALSRCLIHVIQMHRGWSGYIGRWGLFDGDGAETNAWDGARLFKNNGDGTFEQVSAPLLHTSSLGLLTSRLLVLAV